MSDNTTIDLRSDTVTLPTPAMREAMFAAEVGDDMFGDDPTVEALQQRVANLFEKEAALFVPSGTMANQIAIRGHCQPGDEIICHRLSHVYLYEAGAPAALSGCSFALIEGDRGQFSVETLRGAVRQTDQHFPVSSLVVIENTQNRGGGSVWPLEEVRAIRAAASEVGMKIHLDGARIMNACVAAGNAPADYAREVDTVTICFSKGLGAPVGSALAGSTAFIQRAMRIRKMFGGAMRQSGFLAAAALYALDHHVERLAEDHAHARLLADELAVIPGLNVETPETNIVYYQVDPTIMDAATLAARAEQHGVRTFAVAPQRCRAVTHLHITSEDVKRAAAVVAQLIKHPR